MVKRIGGAAVSKPGTGLRPVSVAPLTPASLLAGTGSAANGAGAGSMETEPKPIAKLKPGVKARVEKAKKAARDAGGGEKGERAARKVLAKPAKKARAKPARGKVKRRRRRVGMKGPRVTLPSSVYDGIRQAANEAGMTEKELKLAIDERCQELCAMTVSDVTPAGVALDVRRAQTNKLKKLDDTQRVKQSNEVGEGEGEGEG